MINVDRWNELKAGWSAKDRIKLDMFYYHPGSGNGDLLYNTARKIIESGLKGEWEHKSLETVFKSLEKGERWPLYMDKYITPTDRMRMTQDPWILAYCCAIYLDRKDLIEKYKPSIKVFNLPDKWAWRRALLGKWNMYWLWRIVTPHRLLQSFVYVFYGFMDEAYKKRGV